MYRTMSRALALAVPLAVVALGAGDARGDTQGDTQDEGAAATSEASDANERDFFARAGFGVTPVSSQREDRLPQAHTGVGLFMMAFAQLPYRLSLGGGFEWERYSYETATESDSRQGITTFPDEALTHTRLLGALEWDLLERGLVNPYLIAVAGYGWEGATKNSWQCSPKNASGPVVGGGAGVELAARPWLSVGLEYRITTLPLLVTYTCTMAIMPDEPLGPPSDFVPQRIALTLSVNEAF